MAEKKLFTPGPLTTSVATKQAMTRDLGSRDTELIEIIKGIRQQLVQLAGVSTEQYTCIPLQGPGTYSLEAVLGTSVPKQGGKVLILENGAYGKRQAKICEVLGIPHKVQSYKLNEPISPESVEKALSDDGSYTHVTCVHCETTTGIMNPVEEIGKIVKSVRPDIVYFVDAMSSFGAVPLHMGDACIDFLVSSSNKNLESVPGWSYAIAKIDKLVACKGNARSLSFDLVAQYEGLQTNGQFRFTPPCHTFLAFNNALQELAAEGGIEGRAKRYRNNNNILISRMKALGFQQYLHPLHAGYIVTTFYYPSCPNFVFEDFYQRLSDNGKVIYPGKQVDGTFRLGNIGQLFAADIEHLVDCIKCVLTDMGVQVPLKP